MQNCKLLQLYRFHKYALIITITLLLQAYFNFAMLDHCTNEVYICVCYSVGLYLRTSSYSEAVNFHVPQLGALETHLCVTWDSSTGATALFMDGRKSLTKIYKQGHSVHPGGKVVLGQDFDSYDGHFNARQSFVGEMSDVNLWDSVLSDSTIQDLSSGMRVPRGNVLDWEAAKLKIRGGAKVINREL